MDYCQALQSRSHTLHFPVFQYCLENPSFFFMSLFKCLLPPELTVMNHEFSICAKLLQSCPTLCNPMDCNPSGSSVHGIFQARTLGWVAISSSRGSSQSRDQTWLTWLSNLTTTEPPGKPCCLICYYKSFLSIYQDTKDNVWWFYLQLYMLHITVFWKPIF